MQAMSSLSSAFRFVAAFTGRRRGTIACGAAALLLSLSASVSSAQIPVIAAWESSGDSMTVGYEVTVGVSPGVPAVTLNVGAAMSVALPLPPGAVYYVSVRGYSATGQRGLSTPEAIVDLASSPGAPEGLQASVSGALATLRWQPSSRGGAALQYLLSVGTAPGASNVLSEVPLGNVLTVSGPVPPGTYYARIQAGNLAGIGPPSADVAFQVGSAGPPPPPPTGVQLTADGRALHLTWRASAYATSYLVEAGTGRGAADVGTFDVGNTTAVASVVAPGTYYVRVRSVNGNGVSGPSAEVAIRVR